MTNRNASQSVAAAVALCLCVFGAARPAAAQSAAPAAQASTALPSGVVRVTSVEGITEYRLAERPAGLALPGRVEADDHRQHDLPGRLAP